LLDTHSSYSESLVNIGGFSYLSLPFRFFFLLRIAMIFVFLFQFQFFPSFFLLLPDPTPTPRRSRSIFDEKFSQFFGWGLRCYPHPLFAPQSNSFFDLRGTLWHPYFRPTSWLVWRKFFMLPTQWVVAPTLPFQRNIRLLTHFSCRGCSLLSKPLRKKNSMTGFLGKSRLPTHTVDDLVNAPLFPFGRCTFSPFPSRTNPPPPTKGHKSILFKFFFSSPG